jgi:hypothetical protein
MEYFVKNHRSVVEILHASVWTDEAYIQMFTTFHFKRSNNLNLCNSSCF